MNTSVSAFHKDVMDNISVSQKFVKSVASALDFFIGKYRVYRCRFLLDVCGEIFGVCSANFAQSKDICSWFTGL